MVFWKIVERGAGWGAVCTQGQKFAQELAGHAVSGAGVFLQALTGTERCVASVTLTWSLMATNLSAPKPVHACPCVSTPYDVYH